MSNIALTQQVPAPSTASSPSGGEPTAPSDGHGKGFAARLQATEQQPLAPAPTQAATAPADLDFPPPEAAPDAVPWSAGALAALLHLHLPKAAHHVLAAAAAALRGCMVGASRSGHTALGEAPRRSPWPTRDAPAWAMPLAHQESVAPPPSASRAEAPTVPLRRVSESLAQLASSSGKQLQLRVNPPDLGHLNIRVQVRGNAVYFSIHADNQAAAVALAQHMETHLKDLEFQLRNVNLTLGGYDLQSHDGEEHASYRPPTRETWEPTALTDVVPNPQSADAPVRAPRGVVDVIA